MKRKGNEDDKILTIRGLIIPAAWDEQGNVLSASVSTFNEREYIVENNGVGIKLMTDIGKEVEVTGKVRQEKGKQIMKAKSYSVKTYA